MLAALALAAAFAAPAQASKPLTIYSSFPLQGASRPQSEDVILAIKLALRDHDFRAGGRRLRYVSLDDSTAAAGQWDAAQTKANARRVALDDSAIAYIGEFNSGATANSLPTLNEAGILQVSPSNTLAGLTRGGPGAEAGEPDKYYPTGRRTYGRIIPLDDTQARAQVALMRRAGVRRLFVLNDGESYGSGVAEYVRRYARRKGIHVVGHRSWRPFAGGYSRLARRVARSRADAVFTGGIVANSAARLYQDLNRADRGLDLFAPDGMATAEFAQDLPPDVQRHTRLTVPTLAPSDLPPAGRRFYRRFERRYKVRAADIDPYAVYGYAAAEAVLDAVDDGRAAAGASISVRRRAVVRAFFARMNAPSVLGRYSIDANGDTTLRRYGSLRVVGGRLVYGRTVKG